MELVEDVFAPLIGQIVWSARRTHGSMLLMEFGKPRLDVGDVYLSTAVEGAPPTLRRPASARGDWSLLVLNCVWSLSTAGQILTNNDTDGVQYARILRILNGQKLDAVGQPQGSASLELTFDLGARLNMSSAPASDVGADDEQWSLSLPDGRHVGLTNGGRIVETAAGG